MEYNGRPHAPIANNNVAHYVAHKEVEGHPKYAQVDEGEESRRDPNAPPGPQAPDKGRLDIAPKEQLFDEGWRNAHDPNLARHG